MTPSLLQAISATPGTLPTCEHYAELLQAAHEKTGISYDKLREHGGQFTYAQWAKFLTK